jgi:hypothetical protein
MATSLEYIRSLARIEPSPQDKGLILTIRVGAYDQGIVDVEGTPAGGSDADRWLAAARMVMELMEELQRQSKARVNEQQAA